MTTESFKLIYITKRIEKTEQVILMHFENNIFGEIAFEHNCIKSK